ncbi:MAG: alpha/beta hydrolase [Bacteroidota bacterium]|nr:alpha/beta hydrolase [Bacteroidota bacterium]
MERKRLGYKNSSIGYECFGSGSDYIFAFHGYAQAAYRWEIITPYLNKKFTLVAFDLPYHGNTTWSENDTFTPQELLDIIKQILPISAQQFYLLGYSMGGRIALCLLQLAPQMIKGVVLLAPDGLHRNKWYRFATQTGVGRSLFYNTMKKPKLLIRLAKGLQKRGVINEGQLTMAQYYLNDETTRMQLYHRWMITRYFQPNLFLLKQKLIKYGVPVEMVFARHDKIIIAHHGVNFIKGLEKQAHLHILETGHSFLFSPQAPFIASLLNDDK